MADGDDQGPEESRTEQAEEVTQEVTATRTEEPAKEETTKKETDEPSATNLEEPSLSTTKEAGASAEEQKEGRKRLRPAEEELPSGWSAHVDESTGATYYWNASLSTASWTVPTAETRPPEEPSRKKKSWVKHADPETGVPYFVNLETNESQWEVPLEDFVDATVFGPAAKTQNAGPYEDYAVQASFNARTGQFGSADATTYWEATGRPNDKDGRMMAHFFDVSTLEQNRLEAEEKRKKVRSCFFF